MVVVSGALVFNEGAVRVDVRERAGDGKHIYLIVPAAALPVAARLIPKDKLRDASSEIRPWLPTIKAATRELARCADGPLVQVDNKHEHVNIHKQGKSLYIDVDSNEESVHVSFPLEAAADTVSQLTR